MTDQKHTKETLVEEIAYKQLGREQSDDFLAKLFLLEQFLEIHNSNLRRERDELREALELASDILSDFPNDENDIQWDVDCRKIRDILTKTKGDV